MGQTDTATTDETVEQMHARQQREIIARRDASRDRRLASCSEDDRKALARVEEEAAILVASLEALGHTVTLGVCRFCADGSDGYQRFMIKVPEKIDGFKVRVQFVAAMTRDGDHTGKLRCRIDGHGYNHWSSDAKTFTSGVRGFAPLKIAKMLIAFVEAARTAQERRQQRERSKEGNERAAKRIRDHVGSVNGLRVRGSHQTGTAPQIDVTLNLAGVSSATAKKVAEAIKAALDNA